VDLQAFFDCLHHDVARAAVRRLSEKVVADGGIVDARATQILEGYFAYTFPLVARPMAKAWFEEHDAGAALAWPEDSLRAFWPDPSHEPIGVPQGGSLSQVIANIVLDAADRAVMDRRLRDPLLYLRYLDDIVIVHPSRATVAAAFQRYAQSARALKLPVHTSGPSRRYGQKHWSQKTKAPYRWCRSKRSGSAPWVGFLGYEIRYDGAMRIRKSSVEREKTKLSRICRRALRVCRSQGGLRVPVGTMIRRVASRLVAASVGRVRMDGTGGGQRCWSRGFQLLKGERGNFRQLADLDRHRERELQRLQRLATGPLPHKKVNPRRRRRFHKFLGAPYSYWRAFR
jgi:hypothetical protein